MDTPWTPRSVFSGGRAFIIGDIHGCIDELKAILDFICPLLSPADGIICLGDYVDRGPASAKVIEHLINFKKTFPLSVFLKGNHEAMLQNYLDGPVSIDHPYLQHGGRETFESYGATYAQMLEEPLPLIPASHKEFLADLELGVQFDNYLIVHAGVEPGVPLSELTEDHLLWARARFLNEDHTLPYTVVHGHTPFRRISIRKGVRIGLDTGVVYGNLLTCLELPTGATYQVRRGESRVTFRPSTL